MTSSGDVKIEGLTKYIFTAPSWKRSLGIVIVLGLVIDMVWYGTGREEQFLGLLLYTVPAVVATLLTVPLVSLFGRETTWGRSALLAMAATVFAIIISFSPLLLVIPSVYSLLYAVSLGFIFAVRLLVLVAIADYRISRMVMPALVQSLAGTATGGLFFGEAFVLYACFLHLLFGALIFLFIWLVERPLKRNFHISALNFINCFIAHMHDGSKNLEDYFYEIGEEVYVHQASLVLRRSGRHDILLTVPNLHPGPMGEIGGGNLPKVLHDALGPEDTLVPHGCATHDFNLVSHREASKVIDAVADSISDLAFEETASPSCRVTEGTVHVLAQRFGSTLVLVGTRAPYRTEDLEYSLGLAIMADNRCAYDTVLFIDAHNTMDQVSGAVLAGTLEALEYLRACKSAARACAGLPTAQFSAGVSRVSVPFSREQGFGDLGIQCLTIEVTGQKTAYILIDGNNMKAGLRDELRDGLLSMVDDCELMTTDSHVVNIVTGKNPVGGKIDADEIMPLLKEAVQRSNADLAPSRAGGATAWCDRIVVFGSNSISQLASTVNAILSLIPPLGVGLLLIAFLLSFLAYVAVF